MTVTRDWSDAVAHHEGKRCRVCLAWPVELAHVIPRTFDRQRGATQGRIYVHPLAVVPLCRRHHVMYDRGRLDLLKHLKPSELMHAISVIGELAALRHIRGERNPIGLPAGAGL